MMNDTPMISPMEFPEDGPTQNSTLDQLAAYALLKQEHIIDRDKQNAEDLWLMGQALAWAKAKMQHGEWEGWFKVQGLKKTYVWQARKLHENATLEEVKELGMTEALRKFAVLSEQAGTKADYPYPIKEDDGGDPVEGSVQPSGDLADEEEKEFKEFEATLRKLTPKVRAVAIHHALELLREELDIDDVDLELQQTLDQIAQLAEEIKGVSQHVEKVQYPSISITKSA